MFPVTAKLVAVALVMRVVARVVEPVKVEEAKERKPFWKERVVEVAFCPVPSVVQGKAKEEPLPVGQVVRHVSPVRQSVVAAKVVEVALVVVELVAVKFCRVVELIASKLDRVVRPLTAVSVPVKLAVLEIV